MQAMWYMIGLRWEDNYMVGGSMMGMPVFSYGRTKYFTWGATAVNPDNSDLFVEKISGDKYFYEN